MASCQFVCLAGCIFHSLCSAVIAHGSWAGQSPSLLSGSKGNGDKDNENEISVIPPTPPSPRPKKRTPSLSGKNLLSAFTTSRLQNT